MVLDEEAENALKTTGNVAKDCLDTGVYSGMKVTPALAAFVTVGLILKDIVEGQAASKNTAILNQIDALAVKLGKIDRKMKKNFDDLKAFVAQYSFYNDVPMAGNLLARNAWKALKHPSKITMEKFRSIYQAYPPLEYARRLNNQLKNSTTNPLKMLMAADISEGQKTFDTWQTNFESVLIQLCLVETLACGWFKQRNWFELNLLKKECESFESSLKEWRLEYEQKNVHWPDSVRHTVEDILEKKSNETVHIKAKMIQDKLKNILTKDMFYVVVFDSSGEEYYELLANQTIISKKSGCTAFVYRSREALQATPVRLERAFGSLIFYRKTLTGRAINGHYWFTKEDMKQFGTVGLLGFDGCGLVLAVKASKGEVGVGWTREDVHKNGCGGCAYGGVMQTDWLGKEWRTPSFFFCGYR